MSVESDEKALLAALRTSELRFEIELSRVTAAPVVDPVSMAPPMRTTHYRHATTGEIRTVVPKRFAIHPSVRLRAADGSEQDFIGYDLANWRIHAQQPVLTPGDWYRAEIVGFGVAHDTHREAAVAKVQADLLHQLQERILEGRIRAENLTLKIETRDLT